MKIHAIKRGCLLLLAIPAILLITACGKGGENQLGSGSNAGPSILKGTAAAGKPIQGNIDIYGSNGGVLRNIAIADDGKYQAEVSGLAAPFFLMAIPDDISQQKAQYSFALDAGVANITPLTTLALLQANGKQDPASLASNWPARATSISTTLPDAMAVVNANFKDVFQALEPSLNIDFSQYNFFTTEFEIGDAADQILDHLNVDISENSANILVDNTPLDFDDTLNVSGFAIPGAYGKLTVSGNDAGIFDYHYAPTLVIYTVEGSIQIVSWNTQSAGVLNLVLYDGKVAQVVFASAIADTHTYYTYQIDCYNPIAGNSMAKPDCGKILVDIANKRLTFNNVTLNNIDTIVGASFGNEGATGPVTLDGTLIWP